MKNHAETFPDTSRPRRKLFIAFAAVLVAVCLLIAAFLVYAGSYYHDADASHANLVSTEQVPVEQGPGYLAFGNPDADVGLILYPGAKVEYSAYAPLMRAFAEGGYFAVVVQMPFNFAFFDIGAADRVRANYPGVGSWWVGGHSLGGSMAAQYASEHADDAQLDGLVLLAAYSAVDLANTNLGAITVYGSNDQVLNREKLESSAALLPRDAETVEIEGGNHAGFGAYGPQDGDGNASISGDEQRADTVEAVDAYVSAWNEGVLANAA